MVPQNGPKTGPKNDQKNNEKMMRLWTDFGAPGALKPEQLKTESAVPYLRCYLDLAWP